MRNKAAINRPHGQCLFSASTRGFETTVEVKSNPRKIADIFEKGEKRKENRHWRKHYGNHPAEDFPDSVEEDAFEHRRKIDCEKSPVKNNSDF